jgi:two-component system, chemotaxis family, chemotaxis protein CheY
MIAPASNGSPAVHSDKAVPTSARPPRANGRAPQMKFLVVDDSATMRRIVVNSLQRIGFTDCVEAGDGIEALAKFDSSIAFVITDWNMPNMSGTEMVQALRLRHDGRTVPVLMVTARSVREDIITALEAGVNNYIVKPFTPQVLKEKIDSLIVTPAA